MYFIFCILCLSLPLMAQESKDLLQVRTHFQEMSGEQQVKALMNWPNEEAGPDYLQIEAYKAVATCMMAEYTWSPIRKLGYFRQGTRHLESVLERDRTLESAYLRLLVQLKAPDILNYDQYVEDDLAFFKQGLPHAEVEEEFKDTMIVNLKKILAEQEMMELADDFLNTKKFVP